MYKYQCKICGAYFNESQVNKEIKSLLTRFLMLKCPYCASNNIELTEHAKLLIERRAKINKIEGYNESEGIN